MSQWSRGKQAHVAELAQELTSRLPVGSGVIAEIFKEEAKKAGQPEHGFSQKWVHTFLCQARNIKLKLAFLQETFGVFDDFVINANETWCRLLPTGDRGWSPKKKDLNLRHR